MMNKHEIIDEIKYFIIHGLYREEMSPDEIGVDVPLFGADGLGLDSLDAVELASFLEKQYGVEIFDELQAKSIFFSLSSIAEFINASCGEK